MDRTVSTWTDDFGAWHAHVQLPIAAGAYADQAPEAPIYQHVPGERAQWKWYLPPTVRT